MPKNPVSTEEKIKEAARKVFTGKGYAATRTRDIAKEAGLNLALLNYYFRSKENLFQVIMTEKVQHLFSVLVPILNNESISLEKKIEQIISNYIDLLVQNPDLPLFVLSELRNNPEHFGQQMQVPKLLKESHLVKQLRKKRPDINPLHFIVSLLGMVIFPFVARPIAFGNGRTGKKAFREFVEERKKLLPLWMATLLEKH